MSQFEEQMDDIDAICPYCEHSYQVESEDFDESAREEDCEECGKSYWMEQSFSVTTHCKPDCKLNGEAHDWRLRELTNGQAFFCEKCGKCSLVAEDGTPRSEQSA